MKSFVDAKKILCATNVTHGNHQSYADGMGISSLKVKPCLYYLDYAKPARSFKVVRTYSRRRFEPSRDMGVT